MAGTDEPIRLSGVGTRAETVAVADSYYGAVSRWRALRLALAALLLPLAALLAIGIEPRMPATALACLAAGTYLVLWRPLRRLEGRLWIRLLVPKDGLQCELAVDSNELVATLTSERGAQTRRAKWRSFRAWYEFNGSLILMPRTVLFVMALPVHENVDEQTSMRLRRLVAGKLPHSQVNQRFADRLAEQRREPVSR
jgi:hypothetical protein